jgi:hypothetical protein
MALNQALILKQISQLTVNSETPNPVQYAPKQNPIHTSGPNNWLNRNWKVKAQLKYGFKQHSFPQFNSTQLNLKSPIPSMDHQDQNRNPLITPISKYI